LKQRNMEQFLLYKSESGKVRVEVLLQEETIWLTQKALADLFQVGVPAIAKHIGNIYESHELTEDTTVSKMETVQQEGRRTVKRTVTALEAKLKAESEFDKFRIIQDQIYESDFDKEIEKLKNNN